MQCDGHSPLHVAGSPADQVVTVVAGLDVAGEIVSHRNGVQVTSDEDTGIPAQVGGRHDRVSDPRDRQMVTTSQGFLDGVSELILMETFGANVHDVAKQVMEVTSEVELHDLHCTEPSGTRLSTTSMPVPQGLGSCPQQGSCPHLGQDRTGDISLRLVVCDLGQHPVGHPQYPVAVIDETLVWVPMTVHLPRE